MDKTKWLFVTLLLSLLFPFRVFAQQACQQDNPCANLSLEQQISCLDNARLACKNQGETLTAQINYMNGQIHLTTLKIESIKSIITKLATEISALEDEIVRLENVLTQRSALLLRRIPESYKRLVTPQFGALLFSKNFSDFVMRVKLLTSVQAEDAALIFQVKATQNNYSDRKQIREGKKQQQEQAKQQLEQQNVQLTQQKRQKDALLAVTQGSEETYSELLAQAKAQLAAFQGFVSSRGGLTLITAYPNWPHDYFSQRDVRWGNTPIAGFYSSGATVYSIGQAGCLISSVAMVLTHKGNSTNPGIIGTNGSYFFNANFLWSGLNSLGFSTPQRTLDTSVVDNVLSQGKWAIVGISSQKSTYTEPFHFVVIIGKNGSDYNLFDPWEGPNTSFNSKYGSDFITEVITY